MYIGITVLHQKVFFNVSFRSIGKQWITILHRSIEYLWIVFVGLSMLAVDVLIVSRIYEVAKRDRTLSNNWSKVLSLISIHLSSHLPPINSPATIWIMTSKTTIQQQMIPMKWRHRFVTCKNLVILFKKSQFPGIFLWKNKFNGLMRKKEASLRVD